MARSSQPRLLNTDAGRVEADLIHVNRRPRRNTYRRTMNQLTEHRAHVFGFLPYLLILACPLMHLFHGGHGGHGRHGARGEERSDEIQPRPGRTNES